MTGSHGAAAEAGAGTARRLLWVTALPAAPPTLHALQTLGTVHVISAALPPGEAPMGERVSGEGIDWSWRPLPLSFVPGVSRLEQVAFALLGRPRDVVHFRGRDRELTRAATRAARERSFDAVIVDDGRIAALVNDVGLPIVMLPAEEPSAGHTSSRLERVVRSLDRWAARRWNRRRAPDVVGVESLGELDHVLPIGAPARSDEAMRSAVPPTVSIVVATADRPALLREALGAVVRAVADQNAEVIVVEQGSLSAAPLAGDADVDILFMHDEGRGASRARNIGARRASGDIVIFTDDDCVVPPTWVRDHVAAMTDTSIVGSLGEVSGLTRSNDDEDPVARDRRHRVGAFPWHIGHGSNFAVRRAALDAVGGWDERLGPGTSLPAGEDADLITRLLANGGVLRSGVGRPVEHVAWRSSTDESSNLRIYDLGAGAWIGKALRADARAGLRFAAGRQRLFRRRWAVARARERVTLARSYLTYLRGITRGLRLPVEATDTAEWRA